MGITELMGKLEQAKSAEETYVVLHLIGETVETLKTELKEKFSDEQPRSVAFPELGKTFNITEVKKNNLHVDEIKAQLTDAQIRQWYKPTGKDLDSMGRSDLKECADVTIQKQVRITSLASVQA